MKFGNVLNFGNKTAIMLSVPIIGLLFFSISGIVDRISKTNEMDKLQELTFLSKKISALIHSTQKERGYSAGFLGSNGTAFVLELENQRNETDERIEDLNIFLAGMESEKYINELYNLLENTNKCLSKIDVIRNEVSASDISARNAITYYTDMNMRLLGVIEFISLYSANAEISNRIASYVNFLKVKERAGIERAILSNAFAANKFENNMFNEFSSLVTEQDVYVDIFMFYATSEQIDFFNKKIASKEVKEIQRLRNIVFEKSIKSNFGIDSKYWFNTITKKINYLKEIEDKLVGDLLSRTEQLKENSNNQLLINFISSSFILFIALTITWIIKEGAKRNRKVQIEIMYKNQELQLAEEDLRVSYEELSAINDTLKENVIELEEAKEKAEESDRLKSAFLANMSHEIRTPMNGIVGFSKLIGNQELNEEKRNYFINLIQKSSNQLLSIINDILDISKIEAGQVQIQKKSININVILSNLYSQYEPEAKNKNLHFSCKKALNDDQSSIFSDENKLNQILNNLINNAFKFTQKGKIEFGYIQKDGFLEFYVKDTGMGISKSNQETIFERFRQLDLSLSRLYGGTGLGLTLSEELTNKLGGKIWLDSEPGKGSTFHFTIPYDVAGKSSLEKESDNIIEYPDWSNKTILIAEDEEINFLYFEEVLSETNSNMLRAKNGREAIEACELNEKIDLVLMDIKMPEIDGCEAIKELKKLRPELPIIVQSAYAMKDEKETAFNAGCDDYIIKPVDRTELIQLIKKHLAENKDT